MVLQHIDKRRADRIESNLRTLASGTCNCTTNVSFSIFLLYLHRFIDMDRRENYVVIVGETGSGKFCSVFRLYI